MQGSNTQTTVSGAATPSASQATSICASLLLPPSSSTGVIHGHGWLTPGFRKQMHEETSPHLLLEAEDPQPGAEQDKLPYGSTGILSGNCQETKTCKELACDTPRQPLKNHPSGHLGGWATPWSAEEMPDGQHQRADISGHARTARKGLLQKKVWKRISAESSLMSPTTTQSVKGPN